MLGASMYPEGERFSIQHRLGEKADVEGRVSSWCRILKQNSSLSPGSCSRVPIALLATLGCRAAHER